MTSKLLSPLTIVQRDIVSIRPYPNNARYHPTRQINDLMASIKAHGFTSPIIVDRDGYIIAGHGRLEAARKLGMLSVPVIVLDDLTPAQVKALRLADNKIALGSDWNPDLLRLEIQEIMALEIEFDLDLTGFSGGEIDVLLKPTSDPADDEIPASRPEPRTKPGDIWQLDEHHVGCGDSRDVKFLQQVVGGWDRVDCAFLDSPYNVRIQGHANVKSKHREFAMASGEMTDEAFRGFLMDAFGACVKVSRAGSVHFLCMDWRGFDAVSSVGRELYGDQLNLCIWNKSNAGMGSLYRSKYELVFVYRVGDVPHYNAVELGRHGRHRTNVWDYASVNTFAGVRRDELQLHPTVKPVALVADAIQDVTRRGDLVLDTFLGSGTTLIASQRVGRRFRGLDIDPLYVDVAIDRWVAMTGGTPLLVQEGADHY